MSTAPAAVAKSEGKFVQPFPYKVQLEAGKDYWYCQCGLSKNQPFCDGSHKGSGIAPLKFAVKETKDYALCGCHVTENFPFCDGSHRKESGLKKYNTFLLEKNASLKSTVAALEKSKRRLTWLACGSATVLVAVVVASLLKK